MLLADNLWKVCDLSHGMFREENINMVTRKYFGLTTTNDMLYINISTSSMNAIKTSLFLQNSQHRTT